VASATTTATGTDAVRAAASVEAEKEEPEAERRQHREPRSGGDAAPTVGRGMPREEDDACHDEHDPEPLRRSGRAPLRRVDGERHDRSGRGDRGDDAHGADREAAIQGTEPGEGQDPRRGCGQELFDARERILGHEHPDAHTEQADRLRDEQHGDDRQATGSDPPEEVADTPTERARERKQRRHASLRSVVVADRPRRGLRVELVRVVEDRGLGGARRLAVVVARDRVQ
jgi:hypothetical protein